MEVSEARPVSLEDIRTSLRQLGRQAAQLLGQLAHDARQALGRLNRALMDRVPPAVDIRRLRADVQKRAERAVKEVEARREHTVALLQGQLERLVDPVIRELKAATDEVEELKQRIVRIERRIEALAKEKANQAA